ncbi:MAG TPA: sigma 54-interacting transcriptional regulator [Polyangiaceae bacterium]
MPRDEETDAQEQLPFSISVPRRHPRLVWSDDDGEHTLAIDGRVLVGSSSRVHAVVHDRTASRLHAEIEAREDGAWVRDLGSKNGTWIGDVRIQSARLPDGGVLRVGATTLSVTYGGEPARVPLWPSDRLGPLVARSESMRELFMRISQYASSPAPVLVRGETGTGKELIARALHEASPRAEGPFVVVDCAALPDTLLESELFGHVKGAFTGAASARAGAIEAGQGGTVFLDEIGELPLTMQPKLLRAIESRTIRRVGEATHRDVDVRFVAATHRDLASMVSVNAFREDLYFRLAVLPLDVPPLRERPEDVPVLVAHFLERAPGVHVGDEAMEKLRAHPWLGNVRELRNFVDRAATVGVAPALAMLEGGEAPPARRADAPARGSVPPGPGAPPLPDVPIDRPFKELREAYNDHLEREYFGGLVRKLGRNVTAIADAAGLDRTYVHRLLRKHDL